MRTPGSSVSSVPVRDGAVTSASSLTGTTSVDLGLAAASSLSARQAEVLRLVASGWSHDDIARELGISVRTVDHHREIAYRKLGGGSLVNVLTRLGWLRIPEAA